MTKKTVFRNIYDLEQQDFLPFGKWFMAQQTKMGPKGLPISGKSLAIALGMKTESSRSYVSNLKSGRVELAIDKIESLLVDGFGLPSGSNLNFYRTELLKAHLSDELIPAVSTPLKGIARRRYDKAYLRLISSECIRLNTELAEEINTLNRSNEKKIMQIGEQLKKESAESRNELTKLKSNITKNALKGMMADLPALRRYFPDFVLHEIAIGFLEKQKIQKLNRKSDLDQKIKTEKIISEHFLKSPETLRLKVSEIASMTNIEFKKRFYMRKPTAHHADLEYHNTMYSSWQKKINAYEALESEIPFDYAGVTKSKSDKEISDRDWRVRNLITGKIEDLDEIMSLCSIHGVINDIQKPLDTLKKLSIKVTGNKNFFSNSINRFINLHHIDISDVSKLKYINEIQANQTKSTVTVNKAPQKELSDVITRLTNRYGLVTGIAVNKDTIGKYFEVARYIASKRSLDLIMSDSDLTALLVAEHLRIKEIGGFVIESSEILIHTDKYLSSSAAIYAEHQEGIDDYLSEEYEASEKISYLVDSLNHKYTFNFDSEKKNREYNFFNYILQKFDEYVFTGK